MPSSSTNRPSPARWLQSSNSITQQFLAIGGIPDIISLAGGLPDAALYPVDAIAAAAERALRRFGGAALEYGPVEGFPALRTAVAARISREAGRNFTADNILLTTGAMQGLDLIGKALIDPGDLIFAQFPTYLGALDAWRPRQPRYERMNWDFDRPGFDTAVKQAKFVYTVPNYSNPTGALVSQKHRATLLDKVMAAGTWLMEDDPYLPLQFDGPAGPSILAQHGARFPEGPYSGPVIYLATLSKSIVPGLRVGWVVADPKMIRLLALAKQSTDLSSSMFTQAVALELIESRFEAGHTPGIVESYRKRRDALCSAASLHLSEWFEWETPPGGMFVWMRARDSAIDTDALYAFALQEKVAFVPSSVFDPAGEMRSAMRLNFTRSPPDMIAEGIERLEKAMRRYIASNSKSIA